MDVQNSSALVDDEPTTFLARWIDAEFYWRQVEALAIGQAPSDCNLAVEAARHYEREGSRSGLSPHPLFSPEYYRQENPDVGLEPFRHYLQYGFAEGRRPHPLTAPGSDIEAFRTGKPPEPSSQRLFDAEHYLKCNPDIHASGMGPLQHYLHYGCLERRSPHPLFSPTFYQMQGAPSAPDLYIDYLLSGAVRDFDPHPLFMGAFAAMEGGFGGATRDVFIRFLIEPWSGRSPHPLFDSTHYRAQVQGGFGASRNPLIHYLTTEKAALLSPHPLFDTDFYCRQMDDLQLKEPPLLHYVTKGWRSGLSPHRLFDPLSFERNAGCWGGRPWEAALTRYLLSPPTVSPHYLIDAETYLCQRGQIQSPLLVDYLSRPDKAAAAFHPMFDVARYVAAVRDFSRHLRRQARGDAYQTLRRTYSAAVVRADPLSHYLEHGWPANLSPHNAFDPVYYREQAGSLSGDPLADYLRDGGQTRHSPCVGFDLGLYLAQRPDCDPAQEPPYEHFMRTPPADRPATNVLIDPEFYLKTYGDVRKAGIEPIQHFLEYGEREGRLPNAIFSADHALDLDLEASLKGASAAGLFLKRGRFRPRILFVGHEATRSGAPIILLRLIEALGAALDCEMYTLLAYGGVLEKDFRRVSHTVCDETGYDFVFNADSHVHDLTWEAKVNAALDGIGLGDVVLAVCNTLETRSYADVLKARGVPVVALVHEPGDSYTASQILAMYRAASTIIFPSRYTGDSVRRTMGADPDRFLIRGQGLLDPFIGQGDRAAARRFVREQLGLPPNAYIVFGCGTVERRKGVDYFVEVAARVTRERPDAYFVWVGTAVPGWDSAKRWADFALGMNGAAAHVRFVPSQADMNPFYLAADVMLLTSRLDPFPCVIHEAMASALPIVAFEGCSGAPEAFGDGGLVTPAFDLDAMAQATLSLLDDPNLRKALGRVGVDRVRTLWDNAAYVRDILAEIEAATGLSLPRRRPLRHPRGGRKVFFLQPDWSISGVNTFSETLVRGLRDKGMDARFLFTRGRFTPFDKDHEPDLPATYLQPAVDRPDVVWETLLNFLRRERPCVVIPNYDYLASGVAPVAPEGVGFIGIAHSDDVEHYAHAYRLGLYWDRIVAVSSRIKEEIAKLNPGFRSRLHTIRYGVPFDPEAGRLSLESRRRRALEAGFNSPLRIVYTGRLVQKQKRVLDFIELADRLQAANVPFHMTLIGDGPQADRLERMMKPRIDAGVVTLPGRLSSEKIAAILAESDVFVLVSDFEGLPLSMLEAMSLGVIPVVRDMESGVREVLEDGVSGCLCSRWSLDDMVHRLAALQTDVEARARMGAAALEAMRTHALGSDQMVMFYEKLIEDVFETMFNGEFVKPAPHAYNAPHKGISIPPWLYPKFVGVESLTFDEEEAFEKALDLDEDSLE